MAKLVKRIAMSSIIYWTKWAQACIAFSWAMVDGIELTFGMSEMVYCKSVQGPQLKSR